VDLLALMGGGEEQSDTTLNTTGSKDQTLSDFLSSQKYILGVDEIILTSATGSVIASTTRNCAVLLTDGVTFERARSAVYFSSPGIRSRKLRTYVAGNN
jgi:hypothetical protein